MFLQRRFPSFQIKLILVLTVLLCGMAGAEAIDDHDEFAKLKYDYLRISDTYPEKLKSMLEKMLADYLSSAKQRYEQEQASSNLKGMGVARVAVKTIEDAQKELEEKGSFEFPNDIRRELKDFFSQIEDSKSELEKNIQSRKERLRRNTFSHFAKLHRKFDPAISDERLISVFETWVAGVEDTTPSPKVDSTAKDDDNPKISASELGIDLFSDSFSKMKAACNSNIDRLRDFRRKAVSKFLKEEEQKARDSYAEQKRIRNVKGMAIAGSIVNMIEEAGDKLEKSGELDLPDPDKQRLEVREFMVGFEGRLAQKTALFDSKQSEILAEGLRRFKVIARQQAPEVDPSMLETVFNDWIADKYKQSDAAPESVKTATAQSPESSSADRLYFAQSGKAEDWFQAGTLEIDSKGMDVFSIPVYSNKDLDDINLNLTSSTKSHWSYRHIADLEQRRYYSFRLKKVKGLRPVSVIGWPSQRNNWSIELRTDSTPGMCGFELQAGATVGPNGQEKAAELFDIAIVSKPAGARVYIDGKRQYPPAGESVTPMTIALKAGRYDIELRKDDYLPESIKSFTVRRANRIECSMKHESSLPGQRFSFSPGKSWQRTKVKVESGDKIWVVADGNWTIGSEGETVGPQGYPREKYPQYYGSNLRKDSDANYGALLMKVGEEYYGAPPEVEDKRAMAVNDRVSVLAKTWGELWLDVNELEDLDLRRDNRGSFTLRVVVLPGGKVPGNK